MRNNQLIWAFLVIIFATGLGVKLGLEAPLLLISWMVGLAVGFVMQRSRICFTAAMRDLWLTGDVTQFRGLLALLVTATMGFLALQASAVLQGQEIPLKVSAAGVHVAVGAFLFGIGMVLASGCASGMLVRLGEGSVAHLVVVVFFIIGALGGARTFDWWQATFVSRAGKVYFPDALGWGKAVLLQLLLLVAIYGAAVWRAGHSGGRGVDAGHADISE
ncbi:YeeE/YedE thiosulfate transporter family protein [Calderihabitans maritimus]|uniref:Uncharacterized protein n=1 Tax=Calderihabitans maritimus TaxID=1246530 RepID=A0A1Z5HX87_9FIRM|nr:YeeE/YedE thiosulfate transporter family protein [Calderihabitans maritimus]GAW94149.1 hypothetical protein Teth39_2158 [Calderihabitans maritimus]